MRKVKAKTKLVVPAQEAVEYPDIYVGNIRCNIRPQGSGVGRITVVPSRDLPDGTIELNETAAREIKLAGWGAMAEADADSVEGKFLAALQDLAEAYEAK